MTFEDQKNNTRWILIISSFMIAILILWNTYSLFQNIKVEERTKMELWAIAQKEIIQSTDLNKDYGNLSLEVLKSNVTTPMILLDESGEIADFNNIDPIKATENDSIYLKRLLSRIRKENAPIEIKYKNTINRKLYYGDTPLLKRLKYFPIALLLIIFLFGTVVFFFYRTTKISDQNKLWAGMAKETAHQIGTPLSSLLGWVEILRAENVEESTLVEIEKDINRLETITQRFSKIGSMPELKEVDIVEETRMAYDYLKARTSKLIEFEFEAPDSHIQVELNSQLYGWAIENLVKNAIDAMKGKGTLKIDIEPTDRYVKIHVSDTGKGIPKNIQHKIFEPGFTSKKRGWGLGLSLAQRIIEDYHEGRIRVKSSEIGKGTVMEVALKTV